MAGKSLGSNLLSQEPRGPGAHWCRRECFSSKGGASGEVAATALHLDGEGPRRPVEPLTRGCPPQHARAVQAQQAELTLGQGSCLPDMKFTLKECQLARPHLRGRPGHPLCVQGSGGGRVSIPIWTRGAVPPDPIITNQICMTGLPSTQREGHEGGRVPVPRGCPVKTHAHRYRFTHVHTAGARGPHPWSHEQGR